MLYIFAEALVSLVLTLVRKCPEVCNSSHFLVLLGAYGASLSTTGKHSHSFDLVHMAREWTFNHLYNFFSMIWQIRRFYFCSRNMRKTTLASQSFSTFLHISPFCFNIFDPVCEIWFQSLTSLWFQSLTRLYFHKLFFTLLYVRNSRPQNAFSWIFTDTFFLTLFVVRFVLWGPAAVEHHKARKSLGPSLWQKPSSEQLLSLLTTDKMLNTITHFPQQRYIIPQVFTAY